jgi:hypothetical protein
MTSTPVGLFALSTACVSQKPNDWLWDALVLRKRLESFFNPLSLLYKSQSKLDEAERMYQRALQGYEKSLGLENVARHRPALNTISNLGDLFATQLGVSGRG